MLVRTWTNSDRNPVYINDTIHWTTSRHRTVLTQNCPKTLNSPQYFRRHEVQKSQFHTEAPQMSDATGQNSVARRPSAPVLCTPLPPPIYTNFPQAHITSCHQTHVLTVFLNKLLFFANTAESGLFWRGEGGVAETLRLLWSISSVMAVWSYVTHSCEAELGTVQRKV